MNRVQFLKGIAALPFIGKGVLERLARMSVPDRGIAVMGVLEAGERTDVYHTVFARALISLRERVVMPPLVNTHFRDEPTLIGNVVDVDVPVPDAVTNFESSKYRRYPDGRIYEMPRLDRWAMTGAAQDGKRCWKYPVTLVGKNSDMILSAGDEQRLLDSRETDYAINAHIDVLANAVDRDILDSHRDGMPDSEFSGDPLKALLVARSLLGHGKVPMTPRYVLASPHFEAAVMCSEVVAEAMYRFTPDSYRAVPQRRRVFGCDIFTHMENCDLMFHRDAFALAPRCFVYPHPEGMAQKPVTHDYFVQAHDTMTGLVLAMAVDRLRQPLFEEGSTMYSFRVLYGVGNPYPTFAVRIV